MHFWYTHAYIRNPGFVACGDARTKCFHKRRSCATLSPPSSRSDEFTSDAKSSLWLLSYPCGVSSLYSPILGQPTCSLPCCLVQQCTIHQSELKVLSYFH